jgi:hypothetical protein
VISKGRIIKAESIAELVAKIGVDRAGLQETINKYNEYCVAVFDPECNRKPETLLPIDTPPYYALECAVGITNT